MWHASQLSLPQRGWSSRLIRHPSGTTKKSPEFNKPRMNAIQIEYSAWFSKETIRVVTFYPRARVSLVSPASIADVIKRNEDLLLAIKRSPTHVAAVSTRSYVPYMWLTDACVASGDPRIYNKHIFAVLVASTLNNTHVNVPLNVARCALAAGCNMWSRAGNFVLPDPFQRERSKTASPVTPCDERKQETKALEFTHTLVDTEKRLHFMYI